MIYLDNSATTRPFDSVIDTMDRCMRENYFNASAAYKPAVDVDRAMRECRRAIAAQLGIQESGVIFTGGGTESDNLAILGVAETLRQSANFVCSAIEHPAVAETFHRVEQRGHPVRVLPIDVRGVVDLAACETVIDEHTALVSCMQVSNEPGAIQPVEELAKLADFFAEINAAYFAGRMDACPIDAQMAARWRQQTGFLPRYIESILLETPKNACEWTSGM